MSIFNYGQEISIIKVGDKIVSHIYYGETVLFQNAGSINYEDEEETENNN